jgi:hypothetical protein
MARRGRKAQPVASQFGSADARLARSEQRAAGREEDAMEQKVTRRRLGAAAGGGDGDGGSREQAAARALATLRGEVAPRAAPLAIVDPPVLAALRAQLPISELLDCIVSRIIQIPQSMRWQSWYHNGLTVADVLSSRRSVRGPLRSGEVPNSVALELPVEVLGISTGHLDSRHLDSRHKTWRTSSR